MRLTRAVVRAPSRNFAEGLTRGDYGSPIYALAKAQHERYCEELERLGLRYAVAIRGGLITPKMLLTLIGQGPADVEINNFRDDSIRFSMLQLDPPKESTPNQASFVTKSFDIKNQRIEGPGRYRIDFKTETGSTALGTCILTVKSGGRYQFVLLPSSIIINRVNDPVTSGRELNVATSTLCR